MVKLFSESFVWERQIQWALFKSYLKGNFPARIATSAVLAVLAVALLSLLLLPFMGGAELSGIKGPAFGVALVLGIVFFDQHGEMTIRDEMPMSFTGFFCLFISIVTFVTSYTG